MIRLLVGSARITVGLLFIISGLIKLNDPVGFGFKLEEYFSPGVLNLEFLVPYALAIALVTVIFEVLLGVMLLLGHMRRFTVWSLLFMIVFFTFLTFYSAYFNKVTDCGCFGDALKLTPWQSFFKDIALLILIVILFLGRKHIAPLFTKAVRSLAVFVLFVGCVMVSYYVLKHLPVIDFRAYKEGVNIEKAMSIPPNAPKPVFEYAWKFKVNGTEKTIKTDGKYPKQEGEFIGVETTQVQVGYEPPIHDFTIERNSEDFTGQYLNEENLIVIVAYNLANTEQEGYPAIKKITSTAIKKGYKVIGLSASATDVTEAFTKEHDLDFDFYFCDMTTLKTIVRSSPGIVRLQGGTIVQKLHWNDAERILLEPLK